MKTPSLKLLACGGTSAGFTLIELLVVIAIIAIIAGIAGPALIGAMTNGKMIRSMSDVRQVGLSLRMYAQDNDGVFPNDAKLNNSNEALRTLLPAYMSTDSVFTCPGSIDGPKADNKITPENEILKAGENHWAYIAGLNTGSNSSWPLLVDGTDGSGFYTDKETDAGGIWKGMKAIVLHTDNSAAMQKLYGTGQKRYVPRFDDIGKNALETKDYMGDGARLLEPAR